MTAVEVVWPVPCTRCGHPETTARLQRVKGEGAEAWLRCGHCGFVDYVDMSEEAAVRLGRMANEDHEPDA